VAFEALALRTAGRVFAALGRGHTREAYAAAFLVELRHAGLPFSAPFTAPLVYRGAVVATHTADVWLHATRGDGMPTLSTGDGVGRAGAREGGIGGGVLSLMASHSDGVPSDAFKALEACLAAAPGVLSGGVLNFNPSGRLDARFLHRAAAAQ
jgi:hypothetical protein